MTFIACRLSQILMDEQAEHQSVIIAELNGPRRFPIAIGAHEAHAIDVALKGQRFPRPLTHDLFAVTLDASRSHLDAVRICDLREGVFYAEIVLTCPSGIKEIDCRPSDALALLVRNPDAQLLVEEAVLAEASPG